MLVFENEKIWEQPQLTILNKDLDQIAVHPGEKS